MLFFCTHLVLGPMVYSWYIQERRTDLSSFLNASCPHDLQCQAFSFTFVDAEVHVEEHAIPYMYIADSLVAYSIEDHHCCYLYLHWLRSYVVVCATGKMVADAVVYHPTVSHYLRFVATTGKSRLSSVTANSYSVWAQSVATSSYVPYNTSHDSMHGTFTAPTIPNVSLCPSKPSRSSSAWSAKR